MIYSDTGFEHMNDAEEDTVFVLDNFDGSIFQQLHQAGCRIVAPPVIFKCAMYNEVCCQYQCHCAIIAYMKVAAVVTQIFMFLCF